MAFDLQDETLTWYRSLGPVRPPEMIGLWKGVGISSGHPLDGVLENLQWFGKRFQADMRADPLLFQWRPGRLVPVDPGIFPVGLAIRFASFGRTFVARNWFSHLRKACRAKGTTASLRLQTIDGFETAAMIYDRQPIVDYFRRIDENQVAGMMIVKDDNRRFFFKLHRVDANGAED
jgi:hypothetical protein